MASVFGKGWEMALPGLSNFFMVGQWATSAGSLFSNALSGQTAVKTICRQQGRRFVTERGQGPGQTRPPVTSLM